MNNRQHCLVCGGAATLSSPTFSGPVMVGQGFLPVSCLECDEFCIQDRLLPADWGTVSAADKAAIAAYLKATKGRSDCVRDIGVGNWRRLARLGREVLAQGEPCQPLPHASGF